MKIIFRPLAESHFPLLLKWLEASHVKAWWPADPSVPITDGDLEAKWSPELIQAKYGDYVKGYKVENGIAKTIKAYIIYVDNVPIGYIQSYNAYDFLRSAPLAGLPASLAAFDVLIGEENYLKQGVGSQAIAQFFKEYGTAYTHVFADPDNTNLAAIKAYQKVGFKKSTKQPVTGEVWMILEQISRPAPLCTIQKLVHDRYSNAKAIFWAGSVSQDKGTRTSDLDLVIVFEVIPNAYREAFIYEDWPIDAFIHDVDTLHHFLEESRTGNGISGLSHMILHGREVTAPSDFSEKIKALVKNFLNAGPAIWDKKQIDKERFLITDVLDDIQYSSERDEQMTSTAWLLEALGQFYFRSQNKWCASGKSLIRYLKNDNPELATEFTNAFSSLFQTGDSVSLALLVKKILAPYGGLLWDGFSSSAPTQSQIADVMVRPFEHADIPIIVEVFNNANWPKPTSIFETYFQEQLSSSRLVWVAYKNKQLAGYVTLKWASQYKPFANAKIPEIMDLNVLPPFRKARIGSLLLNHAENAAITKSDIVGLGVGLYGGPDGGYGAAQRLYVDRGYIPDGRGATYDYQDAIPGNNYSLDDDLLLWFTKKLK